MASRDPVITPHSFATFGALLRYLRQRAHLSRVELARAAGYSESLIARLELDQRRPDVSAVHARFVPALDLEHEPAWVARLLALAEDARRQAAAPITAAVAPPLQAAAPDLAPLLATKLFAPPPRPKIVPRSRLLAQLDRALTVPLTLLAAAAGSGKTTLLADWLSERQKVKGQRQKDDESDESFLPFTFDLLPFKVAWLSLDAGENDLATFVRYLVAACQRLMSAAGQATLTLLQQPALLSASALLAPLVNDLATLPNASVLVLDDAHVLTAPEVHVGLAFLLDHLPPQLHLVIASREDPPLPLARLRARGQLVELRARHLRFTADESAAFLRETMGVPVTDTAAAALEARTEGWAAGLQLAALVLQNQPDSDGVVADLSGNNRYLVDYLAGEVLDRLPAHLKTFALQTSILERMCGELCDALLGLTEDERRKAKDESVDPFVLRPSSFVDSYSQMILAELERRQLFIVPLDDERHWYRYHHLFADLLRARLRHGVGAEAVAALHRRASAWYEAQGLIEEAIQHALAAGAPEEAARLVEQRAEALLIGSEMATLRRWIERLPEEIVHRHHRLALAYAGARLIIGDVAAVEPLLQAAERTQSASGSVTLRNTAAHPANGADVGWLDDVTNSTRLLRSIVARAQNDLPRAILLARAALDNLPQQFVFMRSSVAWNLGMAYWSSGELGAAGDVFVEVWADNQSPDQVYLLSAAASSLGQIRVIQGRLREAAQIYRQALDHAAGVGGQVPGMGMVYVGLADVLREWNDLEQAIRHLTDALELGKLFGNLDVLAASYAIVARVKQVQGDFPAAAAAFAEADSITPGSVFDVGPSHRARVWLAMGDIAAAERWATRNGISGDSAVSYQYETEQIVLARVLLMRQAYAQALPALDRLVAATKAGGRIGATIEVLALQALAHQGSGDQQAALAALEQALTLAESEGYVRSFVDEGAPMARLLHTLHAQGKMQAYVDKLLAAFPENDKVTRWQDDKVSAIHDQTVTLSSPHPVTPSLVEPLSERELEVLRMIAAGQSNRAIAEALTIEVGTVKRHVHSLLGKLAAQSRTEAVARARALGLL
jgi:LuxR family transcriptional regulator, maltose regulon positive regulatory protein